MFKRLVRALAGLAVFLGALSTAHAQSATQAVLVGRVVDIDGRSLPGVTLTARSQAVGMVPASAASGGDGRYRISPLPPATDYTVVAELPGHARIEIGPVDLDPGKTTTLNFTLVRSAEATETVVVTGRGEIVDLASTKTSTVFDSEFIEGLPILGRTYQDLLTLAPGVTDVDGDGNPNVHGARETSFQTRVDGANTTDPFTGTYGQNLNLESIAEIEIITTGASAEFSQAQGGFANIITKSGGNEFEGSFKFFYRSDLFDNDGANNNDITDEDLFAGLEGFSDLRPFLTLGGPIVKDRVWYFVALEYLDLEEPVNTLTQPALFTEDGWNNFAKITWQVDPAQRLSFQLNHDPRTFTGQNLNTGTAPESDFSLERGGYAATVKWSWNLSPSLLLETLVSRLDTSFDLVPLSDAAPCLRDQLGRCDPFREDLYTIDLRQGTTFGPYFQTSRDDRLRNSLRSDLSYFLDAPGGTHNLKGGFEFAGERFDDEVRTSTVRFDDFVTCIPPPEGFGSPSDPNYVPPSSPAWRFLCDPRKMDIGELPSDPTEVPVIIGSINFEEAIPGTVERTAEKDSFGFYLQDSYKPRPNLAINVGLRYDREEATAHGWELFEPTEQAERFVELYALGTGVPADQVNFVDAFLSANVLHDINGDGLDPLHCTVYDLDGAALGDGLSDGAVDDFWWYADLSSTNPDGTFNPFIPDGVVDCDNPFDICEQTPDGLADGRSINPACDRKSDDVFFLISVFSRHQADDSAHPFPSFVLLDPERGLPGVVRNPETFDIVNNNVAPRLSVSWDPGGDNKTKLFATWGRYYDRLFLATLVPELGPDPRTNAFFATDRETGADAILAQSGRFSITQIDRGLQTPFTDELTLGFERELAPEWVLGFTYIRRKAREQLQDQDFNHFTVDENGDGRGDDFFGLIRVTPGGENADPVAACFGGDEPVGPRDCFFAEAPDGQPDLISRNPFFNQVLRVGNFNESHYTAYQLVLTRRLSRKWQMTSSYVWSRAEGDAEDFLSGLGNDPGTVDDEFGPLDFDRTHQVKFSAVAFLPGAQSLGATIQWASGTPYSTILQRDSADFFGSFFFRTTFPTGARNDQRNEPVWTLDAYYKKIFRFGGFDAAVGVEVVNLLQSDDLAVERIETSQVLGLEATRRFGRRWQLSLEMHF